MERMPGVLARARLLLIILGFSIVFFCKFKGIANGQVVSSEDAYVYCTEGNLRPVDQPSLCQSATEGYLCQAVRGRGCYLECVPCRGSTTWTIPSGAPGYDPVTTTRSTNTLNLAPGNVDPGCYSCVCADDNSLGMHINVTVEAEKNLQFVFKNDDDEVVDHVKVDTSLVEVDSTGWMYLYCNATGYPDPRYNWTFIINNITHDISEDACLSPSSTGEYLRITPCSRNIYSTTSRVYRCSVYNGVSKTMHGSATLDIDPCFLESWPLQIHPLQSRPAIPLTNGVASGVVAAYNDWLGMGNRTIAYEICKIPATLSGLSPSSCPACLHDQLQCCTCSFGDYEHQKRCPFFYLSSRSNTNAVDVARLYDPAIVCEFQVKEEMDIAMFAARCWPGVTCDPITVNALQLMGISTVRADTGDVYKFVSVGVGSGGFVVGVLVAVVVCAIGFAVYKRKKRNTAMVDYESLRSEDSISDAPSTPPPPGSRSKEERTFELGDNFGPIVVKVSHAEGQPGVDIGIGRETNEGYAECHRFVSGREDSFKIWQRQSASDA